MNVSFRNLITNNISTISSYAVPFLGRGKTKQTPDGDVFEKSTSSSKMLEPEKKYNPGPVRLWARNLQEDAIKSNTVFSAIMKNIFWEICEFPDNATYNIPNDGHGVGRMKLCMKSPHSILEKMLTNNSTTEKTARENIQDAIRGRIILNNGTREEGDAVLAKLTKAVKKRKIQIKKIKFYCTNNKKLDYVSTSALSSLKRAINEQYGSDSYSFKSDKKTSGYNGVHIIFKVDNDFDAELQIIGSEVEKLKDVEDVFYKLTNNKRVDTKYGHIAKKYDSLNAEGKYQLERYIRECYIAQREKELGMYQGKEKEEFVPLNPKYGLPKIFDFNYIASL